MSRRTRILRNIAIGLLSFVVLVFVSGILVVRTEWFRNFVRQKIVMAAAEGTGGRVEIGSFNFDWTHLSATVTNFVIHGNEAADAAPYLSAKRVEIHIRLLTSLKHLLDITYLGVDRPRANILVAADGTTNVPKPKPSAPPTSQKNPLQTVVDLAVGHFQLTNGAVTFNSRRQDFDLRGESLRVQLWYDLLKQGYQGELSLVPLYVVSGKNTPVKFQVNLPVTLNADRIEISHARITTGASQLAIDGVLQNLNYPKLSAHIQGSVALTDLQNAGNLQMAMDTRGLPSAVDLDLNAAASGNEIDVSNSRITYGGSTIQASGKLRHPAGKSALQFQTQLALAELGRLTKLAIRPEGVLQANGTATLDAHSNYDVHAFLNTQGLALQQGAQKIRNVSLVSEVHLTPSRLELHGFRIGAFGAEIAGNASLEDFARYSVSANLSHLNLQTLQREIGQKGLDYGGNVSGSVAATGDLHIAGMKSLSANARLAITPAQPGIPVSGRITAEYKGETDNLNVNDSFVSLPHTHLTVAGSLGNRLNVTLNTADLKDFAPLTGNTFPAALNGPANFAGVVTGHLTSPQITGHLDVDRFTAEGRQFDGLAGDVAASANRAALSGGTLRRGTMQTQFTASLGLRDWTVTQNQPLSVQATIRNADLADMLALSGTSPAGYSGALSADVNVSGTIGNPCGTADLTVSNGSIHGEPIDSAQAQVSMADQLVTVTKAEIAAGQSHIDLTAEFHHPSDRFDRGQLHAHIQTNGLDLAKLQTVQNLQARSGGTVQLTADISGELRDSFVPTNVTADISGRGLTLEGQNYGDLTGTARTNGQAVTYNLQSDFAGSQIRMNGNTQLVGYRTLADANIAGLPIEKVLVLLQRSDIPAKGSLSGTVHFAGTMDHPEGDLDVTVDRAVFDNEPIDRVHARASYRDTSIDVPLLEVRAGNSSLDGTAHYDHKAGTLTAGDLQFRIQNGHVDLAHIHYLQQIRPGLAGTLQLTADGAGTISATQPQIRARGLNLNFSGKGLAIQGKNLGDLTVTANTTSGRVVFALDSNLAGASIQGKGNAQLSGDYPLTAQITMRNVTWKGLQPLLGATESDSTDFDAAADGELTLNGAAAHLDAFGGRLQLSRLQVTGKSRTQTVTIANQEPVVVAMERGVARIESLHLTGPQTDIQAHGSVSLAAQTLEASVNAHTDLGLLQKFDRDVVSSGQVSADATLRGTFAAPLINGKVQLQNASLNLLNVPTGLAHANGLVEFSGSSASFRNLTGEVGGGKVTLSGFMSYNQAVRLALRVNATKVRYRLQPGVSAVADADLRLSGRPDASILSGTVSVDQITYAPQSDVGAILSRAAPSVQSADTPSPLLDNMKLDIQVRTSSATAVRAAVAQSLQMDANLRIQGTASQPGVVGRISINEGKLVFFSSSYTVNTGTISFYNPIRIEPVLDLSLETQAKGVDITLRVTGPIDNMNLSYTSNPPIQFQEIVGLLAAGQTPTSDPTLLANQPAQPSQSFEQMGESAVVGKALADPVANRLQRVFGITQLKIDPTFVSGSGLPEAQLSIQQQVTSRLTLTYSTAVDDASQTAVSGQFLLSRQWSAQATRDQFGLFSIKLMYKTAFR